MDIQKADINFEFPDTIKQDGVNLFNVLSEPFEICGIMPPDASGDVFHRLPHDFAETFESGVKSLYRCTSGGKVKFRTNSNYIGIYAKVCSVPAFTHMSKTGYMGLDLYAKLCSESKYTHVHTFCPSFDNLETVCGAFEFGDYMDECPDDLRGASISRWPHESGKDKTRDIIINMPLYSGLSELYVALEENALIERADAFCNLKPIVVYGNSVTQGACASRPGMSWTNILSQRNNLDIVNLGFSGSARGEEKFARYLASLDMSVLITDYDYNSPDDKHLYATLSRMIEIVRESKLNLPIICLSRPLFMDRMTSIRRREAIRRIVDDRCSRGDKNIYFSDGARVGEMFSSVDCITVEGWHLNDLGMYSQAAVVEEILKSIIKVG